MKNYALLLIAVVLLAISAVIRTMLAEFIQQAGLVLIFGIWAFLMMLVFAIERSFVLWRAGGRGERPEVRHHLASLGQQGAQQVDSLLGGGERCRH